MEEEHRNLNSPEPNAKPGKRKLALEFDLNETPSPLPSPTANDVSSSSSELVLRVVRCGSCGKVGPAGGPDVVVCCGCGSGYHVKCLGAKERQVEWKCFKCLLKVGTGDRSRRAAAAGGGGAGGLGLLDINAPPPQVEVDDEGEGFLIGKYGFLLHSLFVFHFLIFLVYSKS